MKQVIRSLIIILLLEIGIFLAVFFSMHTYSSPKFSEAQIYDNPRSRAELQNRFPDSIILSTVDDSIVWNDAAELRNTYASLANTNQRSSISSYFYARSHTEHPWAYYSSGASVIASQLSYQILGQRLWELSESHNRPPQDAALKIEGERAIEFQVHRQGQILDLAQTRALLKSALAGGEKTIEIPRIQTEPRVSLSDLNNLGINTLIARGESDFSGSSRARIHNISVGAARYDGLIIKPGEEFSFNKYLGPVTASAGFLPELVIKPEGTVPEYGGGLCQVSTTAFRAAFFGGLDITQRKNHSYAVKYYVWINDETPPAEGLDATIYPGAVDMKFINDTAGAILIDTHMEGTKLYFDFFGTPDERQVVVDGPKTYDRRASGAVKASVTRTVIKNEEREEKVFLSNYVSPNLYPRTYELQKEQPPAETINEQE